MSICKAFEIALNKKQERGWDIIYVLVDIHDTIFKGCYNNKEQYEYIGKAKECLQYMSSRNDICIILWSSCYPEIMCDYINKLYEDNIHIDYINSNPIEASTQLSDFSQKFYFSVGIDDKFGFDGNIEWEEILNFLKHEESRSNFS